MGILEALTLIFVILKLVGVISWSWWIVLSPLFAALIFYGFVFVINLALYLRIKREISKEFDNLFNDK